MTTDLTNVTPLRPRPKDPTAALRSRRARRRRKGLLPAVTATVTPTILSPITSELENLNEIIPSVTVDDITERHGERHGGGLPVGSIGRSLAVRDAARNAATITAPDSAYVARLLRVDDHGDRLVVPDRRPASASPARRLSFADMLAYGVAVGLAGCAAFFSLKGLVVLYPGSPVAIVVTGAIMEAGKIVACGWLANSWRHVPWVFRGVFLLLIAGLAVINGLGTFSQLTAAHVGDRVVNAATRTMQAKETDSRIEVASAKLADIDHRIQVIDGIIAGAANRGRANTALAAQESQRKDRTALVGERKLAAEALAALKVERGGVEARAAIAESETMPIMFAAELLGLGSDSERAIRFLTALLVLCLDPLALALTAAVSIRRRS